MIRFKTMKLDAFITLVELWVFSDVWEKETWSGILTKDHDWFSFKAGFHMIATIAGKKGSATVAIICKPLPSDRSDYNDR